MIKRRQILSSRRSGELSWTRKVAGRDAGFGWFLALGTSLDPLLPLCHCHTHARRHLGWTQSLHGARISLLKSKKSECLKQSKLIDSSFGQLEVRYPGVDRATLPLKMLGKDRFLASVLASGTSLAYGSHNSSLPMAFSLFESQHPHFPLYKDTTSFWSRTHPNGLILI